jgi:hypothetical protein
VGLAPVAVVLSPKFHGRSKADSGDRLTRRH